MHGFKQAQGDHTLFYRRQGTGVIVLIVYVDDIILTGDDNKEIEKIKGKLALEFEMKDLGRLRYILGMEVERKDSSIVVSHRKYAMDILKETEMMGL